MFSTGICLFFLSVEGISGGRIGYLGSISGIGCRVTVGHTLQIPYPSTQNHNWNALLLNYSNNICEGLKYFYKYDMNVVTVATGNDVFYHLL